MKRSKEAKGKYSHSPHLLGYLLSDWASGDPLSSLELGERESERGTLRVPATDPHRQVLVKETPIDILLPSE